jgi:hypothetical protein
MVSILFYNGSLRKMGTARVWYNDALANSRIKVIVDGEQMNYFLRNNFVLSDKAGKNKKAIDIPVGKRCGEFQLIGTWGMGCNT